MHVPVLLTPENKLVVVPWKECNRVLRFYIFCVSFMINLCNRIAGCGVIAHQSAVILVAVEFKHVKRFVVRCPADIRKITVGRVSYSKISNLSCGKIVDADDHFMALFACHGIFIWLKCHDTALAFGRFPIEFGNVNLRIITHHTLVHAIECQLSSVVVPEESARNSKLVAMHTLSINDFTTTVRGQLMVVSMRINHVKLIVFHISQSLGNTVEILCLRTFCHTDITFPQCFPALPIEQYALFAVIEPYK